MIISGIDGNYRINVLTEKVVELISSGISTSKILILTSNSFKKEKIISSINDKLFSNSSCGYEQLNVSTFSGIVYNSILKNWVDIEEIINVVGGESEIYPTLSGLDVSQYFLNKIVKSENFNDYFSKKNLMHQLLRRYKLIVENSLTDEEIEIKNALLSESFALSALKAIKQYKVDSGKNRIFDNLKQISSFMYLLKQDKIRDFDETEYFFANDADEYSYATFEFCKFLIDRAKESFIYLDPSGCSRRGYLCGYSDVYKDLKEIYNFEEVNLLNENSLYPDAQKLFNNLTTSQKEKLEHFEIFDFNKRLEMIEGVFKKVMELLSTGIPLNRIHLITPDVDENLLYSLKEFFKKQNIQIQTLTGNKKITDNIYVYSIITILELLNRNWQIKPNAFEIRVLLNQILQIPIFDCKFFIDYYLKNGILPSTDDNKYKQYEILLDLLCNQTLKEEKITTQIDEIFKTIIAPNMFYDSDLEPINLLMKSVTEFENIKDKFKKYNNINLTPNDWLLHLKSSVVSQNPSKPAQIDENSLIISTPQKIVDFSLESDYQLWLDISSHNWIKEDTGTIYNAWVFQKNYDEKEYTPELNRNFVLDKTARLLRKLTICANKNIYLFSSVFDASGRENFGELPEFIEVSEEKKEEFNFIPRDDQKEILNYKGGKMAVPAVPGAGKTTVMLALLVELFKKGINPQNILVLTYMESAARNFLNRFKKVTACTKNLPQISTIHAFAFKILMENNNYTYVNLPEDFSICDDSLKNALIRDICAYNLPLGENIDDYAQLMVAAISKTKTNQISIETLKKFSNDNQIDEFRQIYMEYINRLKQLSLLDYDDLLIYAVKLLKENKEIERFYQDKFEIIIEDEAQDSSIIQQELIKILGKKHNNIIRCGDVNQAILGTFSNSDVQGFKEFITNNKKVEMFRSQRCTKEIYEFANKVVNKTIDDTVMGNAFYNLKMQGVEGKNPISKNAIKYEVLDTSIEEKNRVFNDIKNLISKSAISPTFAILLRTNKQVALWSAFIEKQGLKVITRGDSYKQKRIFLFLLSAIELFINPYDNKILAKFYKYFCEIGKIKYNNDLHEYIEKNEQYILTPEFIKEHNQNADFEKFWWEAFAIIESNTLDVQEIVIHCTNNYFEDMTDKSNAFLFAILIKRYMNTLNTDEKFKLNYIAEMIKYFKNLLSQKTLKGINLFQQEDEDNDYKGFVQIMTVHKAKGAEFDYVYLPEFTDYNYSMNFSKCCDKINKRRKPLLSKLTKIITGKEVLASTTAKEEIEETLRLIYVAITRAKLGLTFSYSLKNDYDRMNNPVSFIEDCLFEKES